MSDDLWRWWEEQAAPGYDDLYPHPGPGGCFPLTVGLLAALVLGVAALLADWM